jgi:hypothetical protein
MRKLEFNYAVSSGTHPSHKMRPHCILQSLQATAARNQILSSSSFIDRLTFQHYLSLATESVEKRLTEETVEEDTASLSKPQTHNK